MKVSLNIINTTKPPIPLVKAWGGRYQPTPTQPLIDMSQGVPDSPPPKLLLDAIGSYGSSESTCSYTDIAGEASMRSTLAHEMRVVYGDHIDLTSDDIVLTAGCNMAFVAVIMALADPGDQVILPVPWYFNHKMALEMLGVEAIPLATHPSTGFQPKVEDCRSLLTDRTKAIALVSPNNPTGAVYAPDLLRAFAALAKSRDIALILDETYRDFITNDVPHHLFEPSKDWDWRSTLIHLFSFSKSYCVPGHRLGAIVAPKMVLSHIITILDTLLICAPRPIQLALASTLPRLRSFVRNKAEAVRSRHEHFKANLPSLWRIGAQGGYFAFVRHPFKGRHAMEVCERLSAEGGVLVLPAELFATEATLQEGDSKRWVRFSVANVDNDAITQVCRRLIEIEQRFCWELD
ncbi:PLP-dependent transferase [Thelephora terrestris]|uniref:PLP-dependent transferase n=1 Tax=Thelephora terrestris TaxID=56493 RepID=A0A9P6LAK1_9AGAM|nr:PLP-dependent transferase [Thelephora terrestris]